MKTFKSKFYTLIAAITFFSASLSGALEDRHREWIRKALQSQVEAGRQLIDIEGQPIAIDDENNQDQQQELINAIERVMLWLDARNLNDPTVGQIQNALEAVLLPTEEAFANTLGNLLDATTAASFPEKLENAFNLAIKVYQQGMSQAKTDTERTLCQRLLIVQITFIFRLIFIENQPSGDLQLSSIIEAICRGLHFNANECPKAIGEGIKKPQATMAVGPYLMSFLTFGLVHSALYSKDDSTHKQSLITAGMVIQGIANLVHNKNEDPNHRRFYTAWLQTLQFILGLTEPELMRVMQGVLITRIDPHKRYAPEPDEPVEPNEFQPSFFNPSKIRYYELINSRQVSNDPGYVNLIIKLLRVMYRWDTTLNDDYPSMLSQALDNALKHGDQALSELLIAALSDANLSVEEIIKEWIPRLEFIKQLVQDAGNGRKAKTDRIYWLKRFVVPSGEDWNPAYNTLSVLVALGHEAVIREQLEGDPELLPILNAFCAEAGVDPAKSQHKPDDNV
jgi:hypothetical protein